MKKLKNLLAVSVCISMMSGALAACDMPQNDQQPSSPPASDTNSKVDSPDGSSNDQKSPSSYKGEINFWHFNSSEGPKIVEAFNKVYPNVKVNLSIISDRDSQYMNKLSAALRSGVGVPDVFSAESAFVKRLVEMPDAYADITKRASDITKNMIPYTVQVGTDKNGVLRALSHQAAAGAIAYKKAAAKQYLGTDDPSVIADMLSSEEKMLQTAKTLKEKSNGKVSLFPSWEEPKKMYLGSRSQGWVVDNKLTLDKKVTDFIDFAKTLRDNKYEAALDQFTPGWSSAVAAEDKAMVWACPTWGVPWIIGSNDKKAADGGRWGIARPPFNYFWGGTWFGVYGKSEKQDLAWQFVKFFTSDKEEMKKWAIENQDFPNNLEVINGGAPEDSKIVGTNLFKFYEPFVKDINGSILTPNDDIIEKAFDDVMRSYLAGKIKTKDELIKMFKEKVKTNIKDINAD
ncbi:MAG: extracellular solute-binding protein [Bacillota bacterium]|nr:extracellular solute-binding protein [Bacillota bacterium]